MKGIIFTEFFELVEATFGLDMLDDIIAECDLPSGGAYTAVGTYDHSEIVALVSALSRKTNLPVPDLLRVYGKYLFGRFTALYPTFFEAVSDGFTFLESVDQVIHTEVLKLYPDAQLPSFETSRPDPATLRMHYTSTRHLEDVAVGLIQGCMEHFGETATVECLAGDAAEGLDLLVRKTA